MSAMEVNIDTFEVLVLKESFERLVVLDISAEWCGPCNILEPIITAVAAEFDESEFLLTKIEAEDENMKIAGRYGVRGFPTVIAFINGEEVDRFHSAQTPDFVRDFIDTNLDKIS
ncbi:MAG TPA: thioredoxin [Candidatus Thioglobus sp.]|jgi:putative thioredoxin|nr:thioredoxin [Candidatus Thioglobus sp.]HIB30760.1 thioredoxin [Candidatus Thioglobus sp.]HIB97672.1 thioredoxin [Candidatus Thioglobus sp.]